ncbi:MAG TPA: hypothetical protein PKM48_11150 [Parvularculaceae bacterium]|nr:hypothetical protein [Parvularculaceae bacterium]
MSARAHEPDAEETPAGRQTVMAGVAPVTLRERLQWKAAAPLEPKSAQKRCDHGLFDLEARRQTDLVDALRALQRAEQEAKTLTPTLTPAPTDGD